MRNRTFNPKTYQGDNIQIKLEKGIARCLKWDKSINEYRTRYIEARKRGTLKKEDRKCFQDLKAAKNWLYGIAQLESKTFTCPKFKEILENWFSRSLKFKRRSTRKFYETRLKSLEPFFDKYMDEVTSVMIDEWILQLKSKPSKSTRCSFEKELDFLRAIFNYYIEYSDQPFQSPLKKRHYDAAFVKEAQLKNKDLLELDFLKFRSALEQQENGRFYAVLATLQYYCSLRLSEAAAVYKEDFQFGVIPKDNRVVFSRSVKWDRYKADKPYIEHNFKNSKKLGYKTAILHPQAKAYLEPLVSTASSGAIFQLNGALLGYRQIGYRYDKAFTAAGLSFRGSHVLRHGSVREFFSQHGDLGIARQQLGNTSFKSTEVYAQPLQKSHDNFVLKQYESLQIAADSKSKKTS